jgi:hypothetical protein
MISATFEKVWVRDLWNGFVQLRLGEPLSSPQVVDRISHAAPFFRTLEAHFDEASDITGTALTRVVSSKSMRTYLVACRYVIETLSLGAVDLDRAEQAERARLEAVFARAGGRVHRSLLCVYYCYLSSDHKPLRTIRLYLSVAEAFCRAIPMKSLNAWSEGAIHRFLRSSPGQAANLSSFVTFCRRYYLWDVRMPTRAERQPMEAKAQKNVSRLRELLGAPDSSNENTMSLTQLARILSLAVGVPATKLIAAQKRGAVVTTDAGSIGLYEDAQIATSDPLYRFAKVWATWRNAIF